MNDERIDNTSFFSSIGYSRAKSIYMNLVLTCAIESLRYAESMLEQNWQQFCKKDGAFRQKSIKNSEGVLLHVNLPNENAISYEVSDYIELFLKALPFEHEYRKVLFKVENIMRSKKLAGNKRKRQDLCFEAYFLGGPKLVIEAKPIFSEKDINTRYFNKEGLIRFTRKDEPYTQERIAALMGYVVRDQLEHWRLQIRQTCIARDINFETGIHIDEWSGYSYTTQHARSNQLPPIFMLHLLLQYPGSIPKG